MESERSPFSPGAGTPPPLLVGRGAALETGRALLERAQAGASGGGMVLTGLAGTGKTVLLTLLAREAAGRGGTVLRLDASCQRPFLLRLAIGLKQVIIESGDCLEQVPYRGVCLGILKGFAATHLADLDAALGIDREAERGLADSGELERDLAQLLAWVGRLCGDTGSWLALVIDGIQGLSREEFSALVRAMAGPRDQPPRAVLLGAGMPGPYGGHAGGAMEGKTGPVVVRVGPLSREEAALALRAPFERAGRAITDNALVAVHDCSRGLPYFLQEWGCQLWKTAADHPVTLSDVGAARPRVEARLGEHFFRARLDRLAPRENAYLYAMAGVGPLPCRASAVAARLGRSGSSCAPVRDKLIRKGMLYSPSYGMLDFAVPMLGDFIGRA